MISAITSLVYVFIQELALKWVSYHWRRRLNSLEVVQTFPGKVHSVGKAFRRASYQKREIVEPTQKGGSRKSDCSEKTRSDASREAGNNVAQINRRFFRVKHGTGLHRV